MEALHVAVEAAEAVLETGEIAPFFERVARFRHADDDADDDADADADADDDADDDDDDDDDIGNAGDDYDADDEATST
jgi:hypothetical protein